MQKMKKSTLVKLIIWGIVLLLVIIGIFSIVGTGTFRNGKCRKITDTPFAEQYTVRMEDAEKKSFDLSELTYFPWDTGYIFKGGFNPKEAYKIADAEWTGEDWFWNYLLKHSSENKSGEGEVMMVFLRRGEPTAAGVLPANFVFPEEGYLKMTSKNCTVRKGENGALEYVPHEEPAEEESESKAE